MDLSVVIVNYNVRFFLEQCLSSVFEAGRDIDMEVWVVDNNSVDDSVQMVRDRFPQVRLIANSDNPGFSKANNQALRQAKGDYLLLLNPDTVVEHDTFAKCLQFMHQHSDCGGLGVKMINGEGHYLKESKRGFPTPRTSFFKISGLIRLFPHHPKVAAYYMGHLDEDEINEIEILPGAFLMFRREVLDRVGYLDESYFMYGEDIDFSWRIKLAGYKNYYLPTTRIIHYKGECTKKGSMNYVYTFYNAMVIFTKRYFSGGSAKLYLLLIHLAIWLRAGFSFLSRMAKRIAVPLLDFLAAYGGFVAIKQIWAANWASNINYYPPEYTFAVIPFYILAMMAVSWLYGGYEKPVRLIRIIKGMGVGALLLVAFYSLLDETLRYSRMVLLLGAVWSILAVVTVRLLVSLIGVKGYALKARKKHACLIVGNSEETGRVKSLYRQLDMAPQSLVEIPVEDASRLEELIRYHKAEEVVFCGKDISLHDIIGLMSTLRTAGVDYRIVPSDSECLIGSEDICTPASVCAWDLETIETPLNRRNKRLFDIISSLLLLLFSPILYWFQKRRKLYFVHCWAVLKGRRTWVGYDNQPGVFNIRSVNYAQNYRLSNDLIILTRNLFNI